MNFYQVIESNSDEHLNDAVYSGTLSDAHAAAKVIAARSEPSWRPDIRVRLIEIPTDKETLVKILNGGPLVSFTYTGRSWGLTNRLGLKEIEGKQEAPAREF